MLLPAMLLTASCSNEDELVNSGNAAKQGYTLPVTVSVTRQGDESATRATYNESTKKLEFSEGDQLFVSGTHGTAGKFAGTLSYVSDGTFSGTITTQNEYSGTADALFTAGGMSTAATLLPAGYGDYGYITITDNNGYDAVLKTLNSFVTSKKLAVEQLSLESGSYTSGTGFTLNPLNAILNFTITGLTASTNVAAILRDGVSLTISGDVTTDASGNATFAMGVSATRDLNELFLNVGGAAITLVSENKTLEAGKIYNISRSAPTTSTVTWDASNVFNEAHKIDQLSKYYTTPLTYEGITISFSGDDNTSQFKVYDDETGKGWLYVYDVYGDNDDQFTFTAPTGKKFTKIEMTSNDFIVDDDNWSADVANHKVVWIGTPSNTVSIGGNSTHLDYLTSIAFTLIDE